MNYVLTFIISIVTLYLTLFISKKFNLYDIPNEKKIHKSKIPNIAGLALGITLLSCITLFKYEEIFVSNIYLIFIIIIIGFIDDIKNLKILSKFLLLLIPVIYFTLNIAFISNLGNYEYFNIELKMFSHFFTIGCFLLLINSVNYIDGIDGMLSSLAIVTFLYILILIPDLYYPSILPFIIFLSIYLLFNFGILPKQFIGDAGSLGVGFAISSYSVIFTQYYKLIHPSIIIWCLAFFVYEFLSINILRIKNKKNVFERDLNFIFNYLTFKYNKIISLVLCLILHLSFCMFGFFLNYYKLHIWSIILFFLCFILYLSMRFYINRNSKDINHGSV